jgi:RND superfamily putative drug exporter
VQGVAKVQEPVYGSSGWSLLEVILDTPPDSARSEASIRRLRATFERAGAQETYVGGQTAVGVDLKDRIDARTPVVVAIALLIAAIALAIGFRSILVPVKAVLTTLLSFGASLGLVTLIFQLLGDQTGLADFVPLLVFATVFGLSMDYEVFLISRVRAEYLASGDNDAAIRTALVKTGRSISLAAGVMVTVFLLFAASSLVTFQELGTALAVAVLLDATLVRGVLVPATMSLLGGMNWWFPTMATLRRGVSGPEDQVPVVSGADE